MNWENIYLTTFLVGFLLSAASFLLGWVHVHHFHWHGHHHSHGHGSVFNFGTFAAFLAWFGGTGYLLERYSMWVGFAILAASLGGGLAGAAAVFWFIAKLHAYEEPLDPADYEMTGMLGRIASPIRMGGTGEMLYSHAGSRKGVPARSDEGIEIARDTEVVITRYEKGVAYVRRWDEFSKGL